MSRRFLLVYVAPVVVLLAWAVLPLVVGGETLFLRDVFNTHLPMKAAQAQALRDGYFPVLDPGRAGGQPLAGNPNAVAFHPDNLLYLVTPLLWAFNAHFWLHLVAAPFAMYSLARVFDLEPPAAWAAGVVYAFSGFFLSQLAFYNLIGGVALLPAFIAALVRLAERPGRRWAGALLWALLLVSGDPLLAALGLLLASTAALARSGRRPPGLGAVAAALALGTLLAAPMLVEFQRILALSFRGHWGFGAESATVASFDPRQAAEWLLPLVFGRPDVLGPGRFWGHRFYTGVPAYYFSLYPGLVALALLAAAGWPRGRLGRLALWAWGMAALGVFLALGRFNPAIAWAYALPGAGLLRYPVKFWTLAAPGLALLCGLGFARLRAPGSDPAGRRFAAALVLLFAVLLGFWLFLSLAPATALGLVRALMPSVSPETFVAHERLRWAGLCLFSLLYLGLVTVAARHARRGAEWAAAALVILHAASQLFFLRPLLATDQAAPYREPPAALAHVAPQDLTVHGAAGRFGRTTLLSARYPDARVLWLERRAFSDLYPIAGRLWGRRYELDTSPEGLDSFLTRLAVDVARQVGDVERLRLLRAWGVTRLLLDRELEAAALPQAALVAQLPSYGETLRVYAPRAPAPELLLARRIESAPHVNAAFEILVRPDFDPETSVVVPGDAPPRAAAAGVLRLLRRGPEGISAEIDCPEPTVLLWQRSHLEIYRGELDGRRQPLLAANVHRLGMPVPAGRHTVRIAIDRRPLGWGVAASLLGAALLLAADLRRRRGASGGPAPGCETIAASAFRP
jgi:hypothetical protein